MSEEQKKHPLEEYPENERVAYLSILSAICYVDKEFSDDEKHQLDILLKQLEISDDGKSRIYSSIFSLQDEDKTTSLETIQELGNTELKYTLISDLCLFALTDSTFSDEEYQYILGIGESLGVTQEQVVAIKSIQENLIKIEDIPPTSERFRLLIRESAASLAAVGVPIAAIWANGTVTGLSAAGLTSGLYGLGMLAGGGMLAGTVVVIPALAVGSAYGIKKLFDVAWKDKENSDEIPALAIGSSNVKKLLDTARINKANSDYSVKKLLDAARINKIKSDDEKTSQEKGRKWSWKKKA